MNTYIALLRGINVSGQKKVPMAELRELLSKVGLKDVQTYIQSGNVVFRSSENEAEKLASLIQNAIEKRFGFEVPTLVKSSIKLQEIFDACPFPEDEKTESYFVLLFASLSKALVDEVSKMSYPSETFVITDDCVYLCSSAGYGNAKCDNNFFERKLKITATARNYKTMVKLLSLSAD